MILKQITISKSMSLSKNYNSLKSIISATVDLEEKDDELAVYEELSGYVTDILTADIQQQIKLFKEITTKEKF
jgi:hypothetical protein